MNLSDEIAKIEGDLAARGVTVKALCEAAKIDQSTWTRWKGGSNAPYMPTWQRVCAAVQAITAPNTTESAPDTGAGQPIRMTVNKPGVNYDQP